MKKVSQLLVLLAQFIPHMQARSFTYHPFVGENADKSYVDHGDGNVSVKMEQKMTPHGKHKTMTSQHPDFEPEFSFLDTLLGVYQEHKGLQAIIDEKFENAKRLKNGHHRLGDSHVTSSLDTEDGI